MELRDYLNVIRARKWVIVTATLIVTMTAVIVSLLLPSTYQGEARVLVSEKDSGAALFGSLLPEFSSQPERGLQTQVQLIQLRPLAEETVKKLNLQVAPDQLLEQVEVSAIGQTNVVAIKAEAESPQKAADIANAMADAYVAWSRETKRESLRAAAEEVAKRLEQAKAQILELGRKIQSGGKSDQLSAELQIATGTYTTLAEKLEQLRINEQLETGSGRVVAPAVPNDDRVSPQPMRNGLLGLVVGLAFGLAMAFLMEYLDNTIKSPEDAEKLFGAPVLGYIPLIKFEKGMRRELVIVEKPGSPAAEAYRVLRNSLDFINFQHDIKTVLVTSAAPAEGKSTVAANLAASLAQAGQKVVIVNSDFRRPTTAEFFNVSNMIGLSDVLLGSNSLKAALQRPGDEELLVLTSGKMPPNPSELLGSRKMKELIESLGQWADWVIIDSPPLLAVADAASVARWADGVLVVTRSGVTTRDAARKGTEMLGNVGARVIGVVTTGVEGENSGNSYYSNYYSSYYYADYYSGDANRRGKGEGAPDSGARAPIRVQAAAEESYIPVKSGGRRFGEFVLRVMAGVLGFLVVVAVIAVAAYFADQALGWGLFAQLSQLLPR